MTGAGNPNLGKGKPNQTVAHGEHKLEVTGEPKKIKTTQHKTSRLHIEEGTNRFLWSRCKYQTRKSTSHPR
jgi:hypothetical protein